MPVLPRLFDPGTSSELPNAHTWLCADKASRDHLAVAGSRRAYHLEQDLPRLEGEQVFVVTHGDPGLMARKAYKLGAAVVRHLHPDEMRLTPPNHVPGDPLDAHSLLIAELALVQVAREIKTEDARPRYQFRGAQEILCRPPREWLIHGILGRGELACVYGPPGAYKTFVALFTACRIAEGRPWLQNRKTKQGTVCYLTGEGLGGLPARLRAYAKEEHDNPSKVPANLHVLEEIPALTDARELPKVFEAMDELPDKPVLVIIDTLARALGVTGAEENSAKDVGALLSACSKIIARYGCSILIVHHSGKADPSLERGSSALRGACDSMWLAARKEWGCLLSCTKSKDADEFDPLRIEKIKHVLGPDGQGGQVTSLALVEGGIETKQERESGELYELLRVVDPEEGITKTELAEEGLHSKRRMKELLRIARDQNLLRRHGPENSPKGRYFLTVQGKQRLGIVDREALRNGV